jgi:hypothetical protein
VDNLPFNLKEIIIEKKDLIKKIPFGCKVVDDLYFKK